ncbi:MAG TPA: PIN domain-containing protein [Oculatellaceae cyanobacterium]
MAFSAIYDACVLYPFEIRDVLMTAALTRCFTLYWTEAILDECARNLIADGRATEENMKVMIDGMNSVYPYANIPLADYESLIPVMTNDPKDRHVLAAAVAKKVDVIVTVNFKDFKPEALEPYGIEAQHPDAFVRHVLDLEAKSFVAEFHKRNEQRRAWAAKRGKEPHSDEAIAAHLADAQPPMAETSDFLLKCLRDSRFKIQ